VLALAELVAIALYALPLGLVMVLSSRRERALWAYALDVPLVVALDLLAVLLLARFMRLEIAVLVSRVVWALVAVPTIVRARKAGRLAWPEALRRRELGIVAFAATASFGLSVSLSRFCHNADRAWHIPLVSSIRSQRVPFANVYEPAGRLAYHYTGDVLAAMCQVLSFDSIHSSRALSLAHDMMFGLTGASVALLLLWLGYRSLVPIVGVALGMLLAGPLTVLRDEKSRFESGYNFINYLKLSYRPHVCVAGLLVVGFAGAILVRLRASEEGEAPPTLATAAPLVAATGALALTDEASIGVLGVALGVAWLVAKDILHPKRSFGIAVLAALVVALAIPLVVIGGSFDPHGHGHSMSLVAWRSPGYFHPSLSLAEPAGLKVLLFDLAPMIAAAGVGLAIVRERRTGDRVAVLVFYAALLAVSVVLLTRVDVDGLAVENHRFMTAAMFLFPLLLAYWLAPRASEVGAFHPWSFAPVAAIVVMTLSTISSLDWLTSHAPGRCTQPSRYGSKYDFFALSCRAQSASFGERALPTYLASDVWYYHAGCHPIFSSGPAAEHWTTKVGLAQFGVPAFREIDHDMLRRDEPLAVVCPIVPNPKHDPVCDFAQEHAVCHALGTETKICELPGDERAELSALLPAPKHDVGKPPQSGEGVEPAEVHAGPGAR
jgi:hypothetical protein